MAFSIDVTILSVPIALIYQLLGSNVLFYTISIAIIGMYHIFFWLWKAATPGKMLFGLRILKIDGSAIGLREAVMRFLAYPVSLFSLIFYISSMGKYGYYARLLGVKSTSIFSHDIIAGTEVVL